MTLTQLRSFIAVVQHGGFTAAARALSTSQTTITSQIQTLEHEHGVELFHRRGRRVELAAVGLEFLPVARRISKMSRPRISRFTMDLATKKIDLDSEVRIFEYDAQVFSCCHVGGGMGFDSEGNLLGLMSRRTTGLPEPCLSNRLPTTMSSSRSGPPLTRAPVPCACGRSATHASS